MRKFVKGLLKIQYNGIDILCFMSLGYLITIITIPQLLLSAIGMYLISLILDAYYNH